MATQTPKSNALETCTCGRCGGTGHYSYNQINGTTCFGCGGSGKVYTKRGAAALAKYRELISRPASEIQVGEYVYTHVGLSNAKRWHRVMEIKPDRLNAGMMLMNIRHKKHEICIGVYGSSTLESVRSEAERDAAKVAALVYQATLGKNGKPLKRLQAAA